MKKIISKRRVVRLFRLVFVFAVILIASCATVDNWGTTDPPIVRVNVVNYLAFTSVGLPTTIYFSVVNVTDEPLTNLTLDVSVNPTRGVDVPFRWMVIDKIEPKGSWRPDEPFSIRGRLPGTTSVYFIVKKDGRVLAKNYSLVSIPREYDYRRPRR
ncbi:MAG: hypothetical protein JW984_16920 [Deltaproteobacteria bacterium]|uniref:Uncharacterized protein n=1 Tax=Candidatus Zymogenus saltonus TaxID=2844893 RepID=A0A9D8KHJ4_9DELT|nr:hypothetical protein [Candidatus Zymogenus saltonus]